MTDTPQKPKTKESAAAPPPMPDEEVKGAVNVRVVVRCRYVCCRQAAGAGRGWGWGWGWAAARTACRGKSEEAKADGVVGSERVSLVDWLMV